MSLMPISLGQAYSDWYDEYYLRVSEWLTDCSIGRPANLIVQLPNLLTCSLRLSQDPRLPASLREALGGAAQTVMDGMDYLPHSPVATLSLTQDALRLARLLAPHLDNLPDEVWSEAWEGDSDLRATLAWILDDHLPPPKGC